MISFCFNLTDYRDSERTESLLRPDAMGWSPIQRQSVHDKVQTLKESALISLLGISLFKDLENAIERVANLAVIGDIHIETLVFVAVRDDAAISEENSC